MNDYQGGSLQIKYRVVDGALQIDYSTNDGSSFTSCILNKKYAGFKTIGYIGISSGNPISQNVNEVDVTSVDFFNLNSKFYQHQEDIVQDQQYYARDDNGFVGKTAYPWSAKLNTIEMGKVAFDVLEMKRTQREYYREQFNKALNIVKPGDDFAETVFKLFEQMRLLNDDIGNHLSIQDTKRDHIKDLEKRLLKEEDYRKFLDYVQKEDDKLYELSTKFATLSGEAKRILDDLKEKSSQRQADFAVQGGTHDNRNEDHHRVLPRDVKEKLLDTAKEVDNLHLTFDKFTL
jgi:hypothetical protein